MTSDTKKRIAENLMDVRVKITVEVGQVRMPISDILKIRPGQMVALAGNQNEPLKIFVNDKLFAFGEAVETNGKYAVRITEIVGKETTNEEQTSPGKRSA